jgi:hypothetical protein
MRWLLTDYYGKGIMRYYAREGPGHCTKRISGQQSLPVLPDLRRASVINGIRVYMHRDPCGAA